MAATASAFPRTSNLVVRTRWCCVRCNSRARRRRGSTTPRWRCSSEPSMPHRDVNDRGGSQAAGLRRLRAPTPVQFVAVTRGKGGVGQPSVSVNLPVLLALVGQPLLLLVGFWKSLLYG